MVTGGGRVGRAFVTARIGRCIHDRATRRDFRLLRFVRGSRRVNGQQRSTAGRVTAQIAQMQFVIGPKQIRLCLQGIELRYIGAFQYPRRCRRCRQCVISTRRETCAAAIATRAVSVMVMSLLLEIRCNDGGTHGGTVTVSAIADHGFVVVVVVLPLLMFCLLLLCFRAWNCRNH